MVALMILVLLMGMRMGSNEEVIGNMGTIGLTALLMTAVMMAMSILAITLTRKLMHIDRYGKPEERDAAEKGVDSKEKEENQGGGSRTTLLIIGSVAVGMALGYLVIRPAFAGQIQVFDTFTSWGIKLGLCLLLIFVGLDLGLDGTVVDNFKKVGLRILAFPLATVVGTLAGALLCALFVNLSARECLAVGAGFGWYTLAPGIIMEKGYVTASAVSFLHNVLREISSIILIPVVAKKIGYVETTGMPGAAAMDVCLPIVEKSTSSDIAVYSFVSGVVLSTLVPILVPLMIG
jgi:uncharacterized membrane protein YbjE (DUF340 family)